VAVERLAGRAEELDLHELADLAELRVLGERLGHLDEVLGLGGAAHLHALPPNQFVLIHLLGSFFL